jgi:hypothetical protein
MANKHPPFLRCKDNTLVRGLLTVGQVYECSGEQDHNYFVAGKWLTKGRFEPATFEEWLIQKGARV